MLAVIDYGAGNLRSVLHALNHLGVESIRMVQEPRDLRGAKKIILPGVGAFGAGMDKLREKDLIQSIKDAVFAGVPYLGICLGMQFLFEHSDEMGNHEGLGIIPGYVTRFPNSPGFKVPHMGWNQMRLCRPSVLMDGLGNANSAYFVHSYYCVPADPGDVIAVVDYGIPFSAVIQRDHVYGVQFHPEKSQHTGLQLLANFLRVTA
jgi:glutamine amidotransferase